MNQKIYLALLGILLAGSVQAQYHPVHRWEFGGSFGFGLGTSQNSISINPQIGYRLTDYFTVGGGINYAYYRYKDWDITSNYLGLNAYGRFTPIRYMQLFAQPEVYRRWGKTRGISDKESVFATLLLGGGIVIPVVQGGIAVSVFYDVIQDKDSPYRDDLMYSVGYTFHF